MTRLMMVTTYIELQAFQPSSVADRRGSASSFSITNRSMCKEGVCHRVQLLES